MISSRYAKMAIGFFFTVVLLLVIGAASNNPRAGTYQVDTLTFNGKLIVTVINTSNGSHAIKKFSLGELSQKPIMFDKNE